ncbi:MAG: glycosyltransferase family 4 protein [Gaiellaceae bacterium]
MRICIVYDCLYPYTIGGAERWYRDLARELVAQGHQVTYLTRMQWEPGAEVQPTGVEVVSVIGPRELYDESGRRQIDEAILFGLGVFRHLLRHGRRYDVVHTASFPYFSLLGAATLRPLGRYRLAVDWHELWSQAYWRDYAGPLKGQLGWLVQRLCLRPRQEAICFSRLHERRLREQGVNGDIVRLSGQYVGGAPEPRPPAEEPTVLYAGRQLPEKRVLSLPPALALARERIPALRAQLFGDGPDHRALVCAIEERGLAGAVEAPGFVPVEQLANALPAALCLVLPSRREGYGRIVVEAAAAGVPSVVVDGDENAAVELVEEGVNGFVAASDDPAELARAIVSVHEAGTALRESTLAWYAANAERLSLESSLQRVTELYR